MSPVSAWKESGNTPESMLWLSDLMREKIERVSAKIKLKKKHQRAYMSVKLANVDNELGMLPVKALSDKKL